MAELTEEQQRSRGKEWTEEQQRFQEDQQTLKLLKTKLAEDLTHCEVEKELKQLAYKDVSGFIVIDDEWIVVSSVGVLTSSLRIQHEQPNSLVVDIPDSVPTPPELDQLMKAITRYYTGELLIQLWHSYHTYQPCDSIVTQLTQSKCTLNRFVGCVSSKAAVEALKAVSGASTLLYISLAGDPLKHHLLLLDGTKHWLRVRVPFTAISGPHQPRPLPRGSDDYPPALVIDDVPAYGAAAALALIEALATSDKMYGRVGLARCGLSDGAVDQLKRDLQQRGIRGVGYLGRLFADRCGVCHKPRHTDTDTASSRCLGLL